ncbi:MULTISPECIES: hypothetical protein [unclassified Sphingomonas]|uniref:hypothetical protein n=1 Tax=unclassified Sphingomonas TaxID=196159 RepID=UPI00226BB5C9|nr:MULTISPECIES: hypothetical protein [unclassified Sphingomonas]
MRRAGILAALCLAGCSGQEAVEGAVRLGQMAYVGGPRAMPERVIEDSRCPVGRTCVWAGRVVLLLGLLSPGGVFAVERGNNDLVLFVLAVIAATLACRTPGLRLVGYGAALLAGLLKYYPMLLMILVFRERPARFWAVTAASVAVLLLFLVVMGHDLVRALQLIPVGPWFSDMFGSSTAAGGLAAIFGWPAPVRHSVQAAMTLIAVAFGLRIGMAPRIAAALNRLTETERMFLLAGSTLILACFFTAQNIGRRVTHLVLVLSALTALWRLDRHFAWPLATGAAVALLCRRVGVMCRAKLGRRPRRVWAYGSCARPCGGA